MTFVIFLAELLLHIPATPGILTQVRVAASPVKHLLCEIRLFLLRFRCGCFSVYVVKWEKARRQTVFSCVNICVNERGKNTTTRACGRTIKGSHQLMKLGEIQWEEELALYT